MKTPSGNSEFTSEATRNPSRLLPQPPGPARVTSRSVAIRARTWRISLRRPTNEVSGCGRFTGATAGLIRRLGSVSRRRNVANHRGRIAVLPVGTMHRWRDVEQRARYAESTMSAQLTDRSKNRYARFAG